MAHNKAEALRLEVEAPVRPVSLLTQSHAGAVVSGNGGWTGSNMTATADAVNDYWSVNVTTAPSTPYFQRAISVVGDTGKYYGFAIDVWGDSAVNGARIEIDWYNGATYVSTVQDPVKDISNKTVTPGVGQLRHRLSKAAVIPGGVTEARVRVILYGNAAGSQGVASTGVHAWFNFVTWNVDTELDWADNTDYRQGGLSNLVNNPSGMRGNEGWTGSAFSVIGRQTGPAFRIVSGAGNGYVALTTTKMPVTAGKYVNSSVRVHEGDKGTYTLKLQFYDVNNVAVAGGTTMNWVFSSLTGSPNRRLYGTKVQVPVGATQVTLEVGIDSDPTGQGFNDGVSEMIFDQVTVAEHTTADLVHGLYYLDNAYEWIDVIGPTHHIRVQRKPLDIGSLTATILDSALDPQRSSAVRPGRLVRLLARVESGTWETVFHGEMHVAEVHYVNSKTRVTIQALDANKALVATRNPGLAYNPAGLRALNWGGVGFNINGNTTPVGSMAATGHNKDATARDQIAMVRDTDLGYAWVTRSNIFQYYSPASIPTGTVATFDEAVYSDIDLALNTSEVVNDVYIKNITYDSVADKIIETIYGPYSSAGSISEWGRFSAQYTMQGLADATAASAKATTILAANDHPHPRVTKVTVPVKIIMSTDGNGQTIHRYPASLVQRDLYDAVRVKYAQAQYDEVLRIRGIEYTISPAGWFASYDFKDFDSVEKPDLRAEEGIEQPSGSVVTGGGSGGIPATIVDANGDLIVGTAADTVARFPLGADGQVLTATPALSGGLAWGDPGMQANLIDAKGDLIVGSADNTPAKLASTGQHGKFLMVDEVTPAPNNLKWAYQSTDITKAEVGTALGNLPVGDPGVGNGVRILPVGSNGQVLTADSAVGGGMKWAAAPTPTLPERLTARLTAAITATTTTYVTTFPTVTLTAGKVYRVRFVGYWRSAATTVGMGVGVGGTATATGFRGAYKIWGAATSASTPWVVTTAALATRATRTATFAANTDYLVEFEGEIRVNAGGTFQMQFNASAAGTITIQPDSLLLVEEVS